MSDPETRSRKRMAPEEYGLETIPNDSLVNFLIKVIHWVVRVLAVLMTFVIVWGIFDILWMLYVKLKEPPVYLLNIGDIFATFGAFLAVLIAIEIFINITMYLRSDVIHVNLVLATALMAVARKVIVMDYAEHSVPYIWATGVLVLALGVTFWLVAKRRD
jgi:uncharacterized membrane protein (DUF373 family)